MKNTSLDVAERCIKDALAGELSVKAKQVLAEEAENVLMTYGLVGPKSVASDLSREKPLLA